MKENEKYCYVIDSGMNLYKIKEKTMEKCFDEIISPLDIASQVGNETEMELVHELNLDYVNQLENAISLLLDKLSETQENFDYVEEIMNVTNFTENETFEFLDMFSDNEE